MKTFVRRKATLDGGEDAILLFDHAGQLEYYISEQKERDHIDKATGGSDKKYVILDRPAHLYLPARATSGENRAATLEAWRCLGDELQEELDRQKATDITL